jgi:hypothetical protein
LTLTWLGLSAALRREVAASLKRRRDLAILIVVLLFGWVLWLHRMGVNDHDDAVSNELMFARESVMTIVSSVPWGDQSPLYFLALHVARNLGESPFTIQLLNAMLLTLTLVSTYALGRASFGSPAALGAVFLGAISPASLWLVRNGRMYPIQVLLSVISLLCVLRYLERRRARDLVALALLCVLNVYNHFIGFFITAILFLALSLTPGLAPSLGPRGGAREAATVRPGNARRPGHPPPGPAPAGPARPASRRGLAASPRPVAARSLAGLPRTRELVLVHEFRLGKPARQFAHADSPLFASLVVLAAAGALAAQRRLAAIAALWVVVPLLALGLVAAQLDVRDRHLVWALPLLWVAIAGGALGPLPSPRLGVPGDIVRGVRAALLLAVVTASLWLLSCKLPERYPQWTKLLLGLQQIHRSSMVVYMPPGPETGTPRLLGWHLGLPAGLRDIRPLTRETRARFQEEVGQAREFVFLVHWRPVDEEMAWRTRYLEGSDTGRLCCRSGARRRRSSRCARSGLRSRGPDRAGRHAGGVVARRAAASERRTVASTGPILARALVARCSRTARSVRAVCS